MNRRFRAGRDRGCTTADFGRPSDSRISPDQRAVAGYLTLRQQIAGDGGGPSGALQN
jgi:hypothetical protein